MRRSVMPNKSTRDTVKYRVTVEEFQTWTEWPTQDELKLPKSSSDDKPTTQVDKCEWNQTDQITTAKKASLAAYLRGLANELDPPKTVLRDRFDA
jgi:hypothetical protein